MSDIYYRDREIKFVLSDRIATGTNYDEVLRSSVEVYIGDKKYPTVEAETLLEAIEQFDPHSMTPKLLLSVLVDRKHIANVEMVPQVTNSSR